MAKRIRFDKIIIIFIFLILLVTHLILIFHKSSPDPIDLILGRYSVLLAGLIIILFLIEVTFLYAFFKKYNFLKNIIFIVFPVILFCLILAEIFLRQFIAMGYIQSSRGNILDIYDKSTDERPFVLKKNYDTNVFDIEYKTQIHLNDIGIRDDRNIDQILSNDYRIMFMGDSFTFGWGVNYGERFCDLFNKYFLDKNAAAFSVGFADGNSPVDYEVFLRTQFDFFKPKVVVLGLCLLNDLVKNAVERILIKNENGEIISSSLKNLKVYNGLIVTSDFKQYNVENNSLFKTRVFLWNKFAVYRLFYRANNIMKNYLKSEFGKHDALDLPLYFLGDKFQPEFTETLESLYRIKRFLDERDCELIVFMIPTNFQISDYYIDGFDHEYDRELMQKSYEILEPQKSISQWLDAKNIKNIDPTLIFRKNDNKFNRLYYVLDGHWTCEGHKEVYNILAQYLIKNKMIPNDKRK